MRKYFGLRFRSSCRAFSLVEVVLALGIFSFCLTVLIGLLPQGLSTASSGREQSGAASLAQEIATGIRNAETNASGDYQPSSPSGVYSSLMWTLGGSEITTNYYFTLGGVALTDATESQLKAEVQILPPPNANSLGTALISVAWPSQARWNAATTNWVNAAGSVNAWIAFMPRQ